METGTSERPTPPRQAAAPGVGEWALSLEDVEKSYGVTPVLRGITLRVRAGSIHAVLGHNGAGKSTLMKIALGAVEPSAGRVLVGGVDVTGAGTAGARRAGLGMVLQELSLANTLSALDNIFLGAERTTAVGTIARGAERREARELLARLGISDAILSRPVGTLTVGQQHLIEIAKAVRLSRTVLILDEPTAPLGEHEIATLFDVLRKTAALGIGIVFITHHLPEVFAICDEVTVLREGRVTTNVPIAQTSIDGVVEAMVGKDFQQFEAALETSPPRTGSPLLELAHVDVGAKLRDVSFGVHAGEIVGVAGLAGSGRTTLLRALFGDAPIVGGAVRVKGRAYRPRSPAAAIAEGVFLIPEDRRTHGLITSDSIERNISLPVLRRLTRWLIYRPRRARRLAEDVIRMLAVTATSPRQLVAHLSGGNQQKIVLGKALTSGADVLLLDEPTFGVDIGAAAELMRQIQTQADEGRAVVWVSSDLKELIAISNRILLLTDGTVKREVERGAPGFGEEALIQAMQRGQA